MAEAEATLICIECRATFVTAIEAWHHTNPKITKDSSVTRPLKRHVVFPITPKENA